MIILRCNFEGRPQGQHRFSFWGENIVMPAQ
jgi:hypothetical protein